MSDAQAKSSRRFELPATMAQRLRNREEGAYRDLVRICFTTLARFSCSIVGSYDVAEDIVQDVIIRIMEQGERFELHGSLEAYLYTAVRNRSLNVVRGEKREEIRYQKVAETEELDNDGEEDDRKLPPIENIEEYLSSLTERQRSAMHLRFLDQRTIPETAAILGVSVTATKNLLNRAIRTIQELYKGP